MRQRSGRSGSEDLFAVGRLSSEREDVCDALVGGGLLAVEQVEQFGEVALRCFRRAAWLPVARVRGGGRR